MVGETLAVGRGGVGHDRVGPVVAGYHCLDHGVPPGRRQAACLEEDAQTFQRAASAAVADFRLVCRGTMERTAAAKSQAALPGPARSKSNQRDRAPVAEHQVGWVHVVVADQARAVTVRNWVGPGVAGRVEDDAALW